MSMRSPVSQCIHLSTAPPETLVRVYTFQDVRALASAEREGYWTGMPDHLDEEYGWRAQYEWMRRQMAARIPDFSGDFPVWAYVRRPNLRQSKWTRHEVLVVADVPLGRMLVSDYSNWHQPLNFWYCSKTDAEDDALAAVTDRRNYVGLPPRWLSPEIEASWQQVFEIGPPETQEQRDWLGQRNELQVCIDRIYPHEIVRITHQPGRLGGRAKTQRWRPRFQG